MHNTNDGNSDTDEDGMIDCLRNDKIWYRVGIKCGKSTCSWVSPPAGFLVSLDQSSEKSTDTVTIYQTKIETVYVKDNKNNKEYWE
jgi:hypothetical protein